MKKVVIIAAKRTPTGSFMGELSSVPAVKLGGIAIKAVLDESGIPPEAIDEVYMGHALQAGTGQAPARQAALFSGIPNTVPCTTINKVCASGMKAITMAAQAIGMGDAEIVVAGGMENMSLSPHLGILRSGNKFGAVSLQDAMQLDGLTDAYDQVAMGVLADECAEKHQISRNNQDDYAISSYTKSKNAWNSGVFKNETVAVEVPQRRGEPKLIAEDEEFKNVFLEKIPHLQPAFSKNGTVTAANASTINDGAAAILLTSSEKAEELGLNPMAEILSYADAAHEPRWFTTAPAKALPAALRKANLSVSDIDLFELNEAFSVVSLVNIKLLNLPPEKVNIHGGAVSLGHPLGCSGVRIVVTLLHALQCHGKNLGAAAICNGGGGASSIVFRNLKV